jgi:arginine/ornithine N-succinyltransferase beta subunit
MTCSEQSDVPPYAFSDLSTHCRELLQQLDAGVSSLLDKQAALLKRTASSTATFDHERTSHAQDGSATGIAEVSQGQVHNLAATRHANSLVKHQVGEDCCHCTASS